MSSTEATDYSEAIAAHRLHILYLPHAVCRSIHLLQCLNPAIVLLLPSLLSLYSFDYIFHKQSFHIPSQLRSKKCVTMVEIHHCLNNNMPGKYIHGIEKCVDDTARFPVFRCDVNNYSQLTSLYTSFATIHMRIFARTSHLGYVQLQVSIPTTNEVGGNYINSWTNTVFFFLC